MMPRPDAGPPSTGGAASDDSEAGGTGAGPVSLQPLHPGVVTLWRIEGALRALFLTAAALAAEWLLSLPVPFGVAAGLVAALSLGAAVFVPPLRYRAWGFALRDSDLYLRHGVLFRTTSIVPHARIQHVDTSHGPIERWLGLAELVVYTAGSRGAIVAIPGLVRDGAESLRDRLAALSGAGDAV
jgi:uncharacterized protein